MKPIIESAHEVMRRFMRAASAKQERCGDWLMNETPVDPEAIAARKARERAELEELVEITTQADKQFLAGLNERQVELKADLTQKRLNQDVVGEEAVREADAAFKASLSAAQRKQAEEIQAGYFRVLDLRTSPARSKIADDAHAYSALEVPMPPDMDKAEAYAVEALLNEILKRLGAHITKAGPTTKTPAKDGMHILDMEEDRKFKLRIVGKPPAVTLEAIDKMLDEQIAGELSNPAQWGRIQTKRGQGYRIIRNIEDKEIVGTTVRHLSHLPGFPKEDNGYFYVVDGTILSGPEYFTLLQRDRREAVKSGNPQSEHTVITHQILTGNLANEVLSMMGVDPLKIKDAAKGLGY